MYKIIWLYFYCCCEIVSVSAKSYTAILIPKGDYGYVDLQMIKFGVFIKPTKNQRRRDPFDYCKFLLSESLVKLVFPAFSAVVRLVCDC